MVTYKNFLVTFAEFLGYFCGISWLPLTLETVVFTGFLALSNQVINQDFNHVY